METYSLLEAAEFLHVNPETMIEYVKTGRIFAVQRNGSMRFKRDELERYRKEHSQRRRLPAYAVPGAIDARYDEGFYEVLMDPRKPYAAIGRRVQLSKERIRQLRKISARTDEDKEKHRKELQEQAFRRRFWRLSQDEVFRAFYRFITSEIPSADIEPILWKDNSRKFRTRAVMLDGEKVLLRKATKIQRPNVSYTTYQLLVPQSEDCTYVFYRLGNGSTLLLPREALPEIHTEFFDSKNSKFFKFKNSAIALKGNKKRKRKPAA